MIRNITTLLLICLFATSVHAAQMSVDPSYMDVVKGENFTVDIIVDPDGSEVYGANYHLYFNNTLLNATLQTQGTFLSQDGVSTNVASDEINNSIGRIKYGEARTGVSYGVFNSGILATITFQAIAEENGISELRLENVKLSDPFVSPISANVTSGNVSVKIGICGDVDGIPDVTMNDGRQIFMNIIHGSAQYPISDSWAADCDGLYDGMTMNDGRQIFMNIIYGSAQYPLECCC